MPHPPLFLDTAYVYALFNTRDQWHPKAVEWQEIVEADDRPLLTTQLIISRNRKRPVQSAISSERRQHYPFFTGQFARRCNSIFAGRVCTCMRVVRTAARQRLGTHGLFFVYHNAGQRTHRCPDNRRSLSPSRFYCLTFGLGLAVFPLRKYRMMERIARIADPTRPDPYLIFASGNVPYRADARFNLHRWNYANFALAG